MADLKHELPLGGNQHRHDIPRSKITQHNVLVTAIFVIALVMGGLQLQKNMNCLHSFAGQNPSSDWGFYTNVTPVIDLCPGPSPDKPLRSHSGYIGLKGDTPDRPKRSFFWYFEAENDPENAPLILSTGGGPGTSGMTSPVNGQSGCGITENGMQYNPARWTENYNLIALDHPIGAGFSYGQKVNNSRDAAIDVYDFLQKFFKIFPHLLKNQFVLVSGSYGGIYMPNIATVIHEQNLAIAQGNGQPGSKHINLESIMISNPLSNPISHFSWFLKYLCADKHVFNETACADLHAILPVCLEKIQLGLEIPSVENRADAWKFCVSTLRGDVDTNGTVIEDVRKKCTGDIYECQPQFKWMNDFFSDDSVREKLGIPTHVNFTTLSNDVEKEFSAYGDVIQRHDLLYPPLLRDGIRLLHFIGADDGNCAWPGVLSFLKLLPSIYQEQFLKTPDVPLWPSIEEAKGSTVRVVGSGAGKMTYILVNGAGHFVVRDQSALVKRIVDTWIPDKPFY